MAKIFGITILFFGLLAVIFSYQDVSPSWIEQTQTEKIETLWKEDIELLVRSKVLPKQWIQVSEIKYFPLTDSVKELLSKIRPPLTERAEGTYRMEVSIDDWKDRDDYGLMIQYQLFDIESQNLIWELGRTLILSDSKIAKKPTLSESPEQKPSSDKTK